MSDTEDDVVEPGIDQLVLVCGQSAGGKSASLRNIRNQQNWHYYGTEAGKRLPFRSRFQEYRITDPYQIYEGFDVITEDPEIEGAIVDSSTFMMDMFESDYIVGSANTMQGWSDYAQFWKRLMQKKVALFGRPTIIIAHTRSELNEELGRMETKVPIKGALANQGVEAYFSTVVAAKKVTLKELEKYGSDLLNITEEDKELGYKHVFQTRITKATVGERIRSPIGMFSREQTYMDNDAQLLLDHLSRFYAGE